MLTQRRQSQLSSSIAIGRVEDDLVARSGAASAAAPPRREDTDSWSLGARLHAPEIRVIGALLFMSSLLLALLVIGSRALRGDAMVFDWAILLALRNPLYVSDPLGPDWIESIAIALGYLGSTAIVAV